MPEEQLTNSPLTSLMKQNLGVTRVSKLTFTADDTLYTKFRKLGTYIERNGDFTTADEQAGVEQMAYVRTLPEDDQSYSVQSQPLTADDPRVASFGIENAHAYLVTEQVGDRQPKETVFILDPKNKQSSAHNVAFTERAHYNSAVLGNVNKAIGFGKLQAALFAQYDRDAADHEMPFTRFELADQLSFLNNGRYGGRRYRDRFIHHGVGDVSDQELAEMEQNTEAFKDGRYIFRLGDGFIRYRTREQVEAERHFNQITDYINGYMTSTYDVVLQQKHEREIEATTRARAWTTKKNINQETQAVMDQTSLRDNYAFVELDNDVDLGLFEQFEAEVNRIQAILPTVPEAKKPILRLRKLGNYKAAGMYVPDFNTIAIDFRDRNDKDGLGVSGGISSFIHEYGHYLDYRLADWPNGDATTLSMRPEFAQIANNYQAALAKSNVAATDLGYLSAPTEIFARSFELYVSKKGLESPLLDRPEVYQSTPEYTVVDDSLQNLIDNYFDDRFPELAQQITRLQSPETDVNPVIGTPQRLKESIDQDQTVSQDEDREVEVVRDRISEVDNEEVSPQENGEEMQDSSEVAENGGNKKEEPKYTPSSQVEPTGSGLPDRENLAQKFTGSSMENNIMEDNVDEAGRSSETSKSVPGSSEVVENEGNKKEGSKYAPYSQAELAGSGLPDRENSIQKFADPSYSYFTTDRIKNQREPKGYHAVTKDELTELNKRSSTLINAAKFYKDNLSRGRISYLYKQGGDVKVLTVKFADGNFAHLTGLIFAGKNSKEFLDDLVNERTAQSSIFVKNDGTTFEKLAVIGGLRKLTDPSIMELNDLSSVPQARKLRFSDALKIKDEQLLLALRQTNIELYSPISLLNLRNTRSNYDDYSKVPENQVLAVLSETPNGLGGANISVISVNDKYLTQENLFQVGQAMTELSLKAMQRVSGDSTVVHGNEEAFDQLMSYFDEEARKASQSADEAQAESVEQNANERSAENLDESVNAEDKGVNLDTSVDNPVEQSVAENGRVNEDNEDTLETDPATVEASQETEVSSSPQSESEETPTITDDESQPTQPELAAKDSTVPVESASVRAEASSTPKIEKASVATAVDQLTQPATPTQNPVPSARTNRPRGRRLPKEAVNVARRRDILEVADRLGMKLHRFSQTYKWDDHDSLTIFPQTNSFKWFSKGDGHQGDPIQLVMEVNEVSFTQAVAWLNQPGFTGEAPVRVREQQQDFRYLLRDSDHPVAVRDYMIKQRGLAPKTVDTFMEKGLLTQANYLNRYDSNRNKLSKPVWEAVGVFKRFDENGKLVGAALEGLRARPEIHGTDRPRLKYNVANSDGHYGVSLQIGEPKHIVICESPIDMMSYYELKSARGQLQDTVLIGLNGVSNERAIAKAYQLVNNPTWDGKQDFLTQYNNHLDNLAKEGRLRQDPYLTLLSKGHDITLAVDNDEAGIKFYESLKQRFNRIPINLDVPPKAPGAQKMDWNDYLKALKTNGQALTKELPNVVPAQAMAALQREQARLAASVQLADQFRADNGGYVYLPQDLQTLADRHPSDQELTRSYEFNDDQIVQLRTLEAMKEADPAPRWQDVISAPETAPNVTDQSEAEVMRDVPPVSAATTEAEKPSTKVEEKSVASTPASTTLVEPPVTEVAAAIAATYDPQPEKMYDRLKSRENQAHLPEVALAQVRQYAQNPTGFRQYLDFISLNPAMSLRNAALVQQAHPGTKMVRTYKQWTELHKELGLRRENVKAYYYNYNNQRYKARRLHVKPDEKSFKLFRPNIQAVIVARDEKGQIIRETGKSGKSILVMKPYEQRTPLEDQQIKSGKAKVYPRYEVDEHGKETFSAYDMFAIEQTNLKPEAYEKVLGQPKLNLTKPNEASALQESLADTIEKFGGKLKFAKADELADGQTGKFDPQTKTLLLKAQPQDPAKEVAAELDLVGQLIAHADQKVGEAPDPNRPHRGSGQIEQRRQTEAEMVAYVLKARYGIDQSKVSDQQLNTWSKELNGLSDTQLRRTLDRIHKRTSDVTKHLDEKALHIMKKRIVPQVQEPTRNPSPKR